MIGPTGLFVIETKNYSGKYQIKGNHWYYYKNSKLIKFNNNPGTQLIRNILDLKDFLGIKKSKIYANGIVAFIQDNYTITKKPENYKVLISSKITEHILNCPKNDNLEILDKMAQKIEPYCTEFSYVPETEYQNENTELDDTENIYNLLNSSSGKERSHAVYLMGESKDPQYLETLCEALNDKNGNVRRLSASALGKIGDNRAENHLIEILNDPKPQVRQYAAKALGQVGTVKSIKYLNNLTNDEKEYVQESAKLAISQINLK